MWPCSFQHPVLPIHSLAISRAVQPAPCSGSVPSQSLLPSECSCPTPPPHQISAQMPYPRGFPGGAVVENLPANAGDTCSSPGLGRSHVPRSNWAREPQLLSLRVWSLCSATGEAVIVRGHRDEDWPPLAATRESPRTETKTQHSHK